MDELELFKMAEENIMVAGGGGGVSLIWFTLKGVYKSLSKKIADLKNDIDLLRADLKKERAINDEKFKIIKQGLHKEIEIRELKFDELERYTRETFCTKELCQSQHKAIAHELDLMRKGCGI